MNDRARRIANLSPEQRRLLELMLQERAQARGRGHPGTPSLFAKRPAGGLPALDRAAAVLALRAASTGPRLSSLESRDASARAARRRGAGGEPARDLRASRSALHTSSETRDSGEPVQIVGPPRPVPLTRVDLRELPPPAREAEAHRLLVREAGRPFDLSRDVLLRATLLPLDDEEHLLLLVVHHIALDGWSVDVLFRELGAFYKALRSGGWADLPELPVQYADYAAWQQQRLQEGALRRQAEYWRKQLADAPRELDVDCTPGLFGSGSRCTTRPAPARSWTACGSSPSK